MHQQLSKNLFDDQTTFCTDERLLKTRSWEVILRDYPVLIIEFTDPNKKSIRVKMNCNDWDDKPPSIEILNNEGVPLTLDQFPKGHGVFNASAHPKTQKPFICTPGSLEYHEHSSHVADLWDNYKSKAGYDLGGILTQLWHAWRKTK